ncbi:hypothetical protein EC968_000290 [Mortierella alpina]|nr:hypothetical protein EC968_000290 [Mortierella alpina]
MAPSIRVLIVGGGIGGLMLGLMLERAGIEYQILERSPEHRPLGSAISMNGTVLRLFEQLGLLEEIYKISKFAGRLNFVKEDKEMQGHVDLEHFRDRYGYPGVLFGRPDLFKVLAAHIPDGKLLMSKRILSTSQTEEGVMVRCSDNSIYHGDILVGADGAYSSVRQCMHKSLKEKGLLSKADSQQLKFDQHCVVGITDPLSAEKYPILRDQTCDVYGIMGSKRPYTVWLIPITGNRFAWSIGGRIPDSEVGQEDVRSFSFAEWWPELATDVCDLVRDYALPDLTTSFSQDERYKNFAFSDEYSNGNHPNCDSASVSDSSSLHSAAHTEHTPVSSNSSSYGGDNGGIHHAKVNNGVAGHASSILTSTSDPANGHISKHQPPPAKPGTVAEILDATPSERISKVMLESKLFKVWHHERTVLIGDACHKVLPFAGQGAIQAILDGVALANAIYDMESNSIYDITKAFKKYSNERIPVAKAAVTGSRSMGKLLNVQGRLLDIFRRISFSHAPTWVLRLATDKLHLHRPQLTYLPMVPDRGVAKAHKQEYSAKYLKKLAQDRQAFQKRQNSATATADKAGEEASLEHDKQHHDEQERLEEHQHHYRHSHHEDSHHHQSHHQQHESLREYEDSAQRPERSFAAGHSTKHHPRQALTARKMSLHSLSLEPPPLPTEAPPRHHPQVYLHHQHQHHHQEERKHHQAPSTTRSSSSHSSPSSSSYSLISGSLPPIPQLTPAGGSDDPTRPTRHRRHTQSRSVQASSRAMSHEILPPHPPLLSSMPQLYDTLNHLSLQIDGYSNGAGDLHSQVSSPPRSPLSFSDTKSIQSNESIISNTSHFRQAHKPIHSVEQERPQYSSEQNSANMKEGATLRGQRSDGQLNVARAASSRQLQESTLHQDYYHQYQQQP